jgi:N-acetylglutamate synthase-like GNAT family acetyltransferase
MNVRRAEFRDTKEISDLMTQLGYDATSSLLDKKLTEFSTSPIDAVFVAEVHGTITGCISCHITSLFHQEGSAGRITSLVIDQEKRGMGVGKLLVSEAEAFFHLHGCVKSEVTSGDHRPEAHVFYKSCGYKQDERRFLKLYS